MDHHILSQFHSLPLYLEASINPPLSAKATGYYDTDLPGSGNQSNVSTYNQNTYEPTAPALIQPSFSDQPVANPCSPPLMEVAYANSYPSQPATIHQGLAPWYPRASNSSLSSIPSLAVDRRDNVPVWDGSCMAIDDGNRAEFHIRGHADGNIHSGEELNTTLDAVSRGLNLGVSSGILPTDQSIGESSICMIWARRSKSRWMHHTGPAVSEPNQPGIVSEDGMFHSANASSQLVAPPPAAMASMHLLDVAGRSQSELKPTELWPRSNPYSHRFSQASNQSGLNGSKPYSRNYTQMHYWEKWNRISRFPSVVEELDPHTKAIVDDYLLRYLNYLCMNYEAVDRTGCRIHQQYTVRRLEREEQMYGWRPLKLRIEAFVNAFIDVLTEEGISFEVILQIPSYLSRSNIFSRFNEAGNRMKSQGQNIWRVRARCKSTSRLIVYRPLTGIGQSAVSLHTYPTPFIPTGRTDRMLCDPPLLWEFLPYERSIIGQPPIAVVGRPWRWSLRVHDHWTSRKKVHWKLIVDTPIRTTASASDPEARPHAGNSTAQPSISWINIRDSQLFGTPFQPGSYPLSIEAICQEDGKAEPVIVRGSFTVNALEDAMRAKRGGSYPTAGASNEPKYGWYKVGVEPEAPRSARTE
ncbi:hypothetical protein FRC18_005034 [Serendipita sp. 400]|nr:hypothetical protein FRC18_005034 [Serendipita sp. 400]